MMKREGMRKQAKVVPLGADHLHTLHALTRKYAEIAGQIDHARSKVQELTTDLVHVENVIRIFDPDIDISRIRAKHVSVRDPATNGEMTRILLDALRDSAQPLTPRELTEHLMEKRGLAMEDRDLFAIMLKRVRAWLRSQRGRGILGPDATDGPAQLWSVVR